MQKKLTKYMTLLFFAAMAVSMLLFPGQSAALALDGLNLWFLKMIPALLPFMILSGLLILIGFLCGFPMGARVCAQSLSAGKISKKEASLLLAFTNNIGPVYFAGYMLSLFPVTRPLTVWTGMYAVPLLYGIILRCTLYRTVPFSDKACLSEAVVTPSRLLSCLHESILSGLSSITALGGYMIFCSLLNLLPMILLSSHPALTAMMSPLFEVTSGLARLPKSARTWAYIVLPFGGLSCIAQTYSCIQGTGLSMKEYVFHKAVLTVLTAAWYQAVRIL